MKAHEWLDGLADDLDKADREGTAEDAPEGVRFIRLSDTLARQMTTSFRRIANALRGSLDIELGG